MAFDRAMSQTPGSTAGLTLLKLPTHPGNNEIAMHTFRAAGPWRSDAAAADKVERMMTFLAQCVYGNPDDTILLSIDQLTYCTSQQFFR